MAAACRGRQGCVALLLNAHADPNVKNQRGYTALEAAVDAAHGECAALLLAHGARSEAPPRPATARHEARGAGVPFFSRYERGAASQAWWALDGMPKQARRCRELDAQLARHVMSAAPDSQLLETPTDRFAKVERAHAARLRDEQQRRLGVAEREAVRERKVDAWRERVHSASLRLQASRETRGTRG